MSEAGEHWIDRAWKDVLKGDMDDAIAFFMPSLASERDYTKIPEAIDPVHNAIGGTSDKDSNISDVCFKVPLKNGEFSRTLFLVEQQHDVTRGKDLALRIFQSWYRASDEYHFPVTVLAIYTGNAKPVNTYFKEWHGTSVKFTFNTYSVSDEADIEKLKSDERPFAIPVLASKRMLDASGAPSKRAEYSLELLELIKARCFKSEKAFRFRKFVENILQLNKGDIDPKIREVWKVQFKTQEEIRKEIYIHAVREEAIEEGREEGREKGREEGIMEGMLKVAKNLLTNGVSLDIIAQSTGLNKDEILALR